MWDGGGFTYFKGNEGANAAGGDSLPSGIISIVIIGRRTSPAQRTILTATLYQNCT